MCVGVVNVPVVVVMVVVLSPCPCVPRKHYTHTRKLWIKVMDEDKGLDDTLGKACLDIEEFKPTSEFKGVDLLIDKNMISRDAVIWLKVKYED